MLYKAIVTEKIPEEANIIKLPCNLHGTISIIKMKMLKKNLLYVLQGNKAALTILIPKWKELE